MVYAHSTKKKKKKKQTNKQNKKQQQNKNKNWTISSTDWSAARKSNYGTRSV